MEEGGDAGSRAIRLPALLKALGILVAFVAVSALFALLLRPLADLRRDDTSIAIKQVSEPVADKAAPRIAASAIPKTAAAVTAPAPIPAAPPSAPVPPGPKVAVLVTELGDDLPVGTRAIEKLPPAIGLAFLPGRPGARSLAQKALADGHEVWIGLPMQPRSWPRVSPGPNTLLVGESAEANRKRAEWALSQIDRPTGAYTMMGSAFTADATAMAPIAAVLKARGLVLIDARSTGATVAARTMREAGGRAVSNNLFLDADLRPAQVDAMLRRLARQAKADGQALGIARALPVTLAALPQWSEKLAAEGVTLVPPSMLAQ